MWNPALTRLNFREVAGGFDSGSEQDYPPDDHELNHDSDLNGNPLIETSVHYNIDQRCRYFDNPLVTNFRSFRDFDETSWGGQRKLVVGCSRGVGPK